MSRIERALEKAIRMRESTKEAILEEVPVAELQVAPLTFEVGAPMIDVASVDKHVVTLTDPYSHAAEQYRKLRARILRATRKDSHNTIMVTSADASEGKSLTALNLAVSLSNEIDHTVLLVDADLRNPSIHKLLGMEQCRGLNDYLKGDADIADLLVKTGVGKLVILPGGNLSDNSAELLSSQKMKMLVNEMKLRYKERYIIFDSSPLLLTADPISLGSYMDGILFVIQEGRTAQEKVAQCMTLLKGCNIFGVVFNNAWRGISKDQYPYYYRYNTQRTETKSEKGNDAGL